MFGFGFLATVGSIIAGGAVAAVTVVGLVNSTVESAPSHSGDVSQATTISYGSTSGN
ncbi:hypothetical protein [Nocardioides sp. Kera G14]|uniref:hypothetical protein n=1 Tax=Nocardioides sp. Kera G14 TaxID=2884264 RepID=UPI001D0FC83F|nr:hypothetical protein [Nocardioides sp. Kera G14]UDY22426.1 hypothetical protein LH076_10070 [Nocardioides sp. Kera G14]